MKDQTTPMVLSVKKGGKRSMNNSKYDKIQSPNSIESLI